MKIWGKWKIQVDVVQNDFRDYILDEVSKESLWEELMLVVVEQQEILV